MLTIRDYLNDLPTQGYSTSSTSLPKLGRIAEIRPFPTRKLDMMNALENFYSNDANIVGILGKLKPFERELLEERIRSAGPLEENEIIEIAKKHNRNLSDLKNKPFIQLFDELSHARLLFISGSSIPEILLKLLRKHVKPYVIQYTPVEKFDPEDEIIGEIILREHFKDDFVRLIRLINTAKLATTKESNLITKASVIKINSVLGEKEYIVNGNGDIEDIKNSKETTRIYGLYMLLIAGNIIRINNSCVALTLEAENFVKLNPVKMCDRLLKAYIGTPSVYEIDRIRELKIKTRYQPILKKCRETILDHLRICPVDKWISMGEFFKNIKKTDRYFLVNEVGEIMSYSEYDRYYYGRMQKWHEIEGRLIEVVFLEYLNTIGIIDTAVTTDTYISNYGYTETEYLSLNYFRLTPMGAYVIGSTDKYVQAAEEEEKASGFLVQPNYEIIVSEGKFKQVHNMFFDRFAEKVADDAASIYRLNFKSIVNALDSSIAVNEITEYLEKYSNNPLPDNVKKTLEDWEKESKRLRIRKVTIVETDDKYLMEELKSLKTIRNHIQKELTYAAEIDAKSAMKLKREIEKKNHFCIVE